MRPGSYPCGKGLDWQPSRLFPTLLLLCSQPFLLPLLPPRLVFSPPSGFSLRAFFFLFSVPFSVYNVRARPGSWRQLVPHDENNQTREAFPQSMQPLSPILQNLLSNYFIFLLGYTRSLRHPHRFLAPRPSQAILPQFPSLVYNVGSLFPDIISPFQFSSLVTKLPKIWHL